MKLKYWILFVAIQSVGLLLPRFGNVHSNILPILVGPILLLPGSLIGFFFPDSSSLLVNGSGYALVIGINLAAWYFVAKLGRRRRES